MRYLIIGDIHSNWEALQAVLSHAEGQYDRILSTGDLVGYGADPNAIVDWCRSNLSAAVRGNHDRGCSGISDVEWFSPRAGAAVAWTMEQLAPENLAYLRSLPQGPLEVDSLFQLVHGSPADEDEYVIESTDASELKQSLSVPLTFFGHTHLQGGFVVRPGGVETIPRVPLKAEERVIRVADDGFCLVNPGSVGQPRDHDPRAAYLIYASKEKELIYRRAAYDIAGAQCKIRRAGLPAGLADRLAAGR
jgi:predicted phosphodiesterase